MFRKEIIKWHKKVCLKIKCKILRGKKTIIYFIVYLIVMMKIIMLGLRNFVARSNDLDSNVLLAFLLTDAKQAKPLIWIFFIIKVSTHHWALYMFSVFYVLLFGQLWPTISCSKEPLLLASLKQNVIFKNGFQNKLFGKKGMH